jgi:hypothetical protein
VLSVAACVDRHESVAIAWRDCHDFVNKQTAFRNGLGPPKEKVRTGARTFSGEHDTPGVGESGRFCGRRFCNGTHECSSMFNKASD